MINLRKQITGVLQTVTSDVYYQTAPETADFPYIVYDLTSVNLYGEYNTAMLDVDIWDYGDNSYQVETLLAVLRNALKGKTIHTDDFSAALYGETVLSLSDPDPKTRRRRASYQINIFEKGD